MTVTVNKEKLLSKVCIDKEYSKDLNKIKEVPNIYYDFQIVCSVVVPEMSDKEFKKLPIITGSLDFLKDKAEDIYTLEDGEPVDE